MERNAYFIMKIAVITGASSGMGREFVLQLSRREQFDEIWVIARRKERLEALKPLVHTPLRVVPLDLPRSPGGMLTPRCSRPSSRMSGCL